MKIFLKGKVKNVSVNQRLGGHVGFESLRKTRPLEDLQRNISGLMASHAVVLENKLKMSRPIRGKDSHLGFLIASKIYKTSSGIILVTLVAGHAVILKKLKMCNVYDIRTDRRTSDTF